MFADVGFSFLKVSLSFILLTVVVGISGYMSFILPVGMLWLAAWFMIFLKVFSAVLILVDGSRPANFPSVSSLKRSQLAFLKFTKVLLQLVVVVDCVAMVMMIGR